MCVCVCVCDLSHLDVNSFPAGKNKRSSKVRRLHSIPLKEDGKNG